MPCARQLVLEPVDVIFRRKPLRRLAVVAEQIAHRVVVLRVREAADQLLRRGLAFARR